jgi:hypothetical protein
MLFVTSSNEERDKDPNAEEIKTRSPANGLEVPRLSGAKSDSQGRFQKPTHPFATDQTAAGVRCKTIKLPLVALPLVA